MGTPNFRPTPAPRWTASVVRRQAPPTSAPTTEPASAPACPASGIRTRTAAATFSRGSRPACKTLSTKTRPETTAQQTSKNRQDAATDARAGCLRHHRPTLARGRSGWAETGAPASQCSTSSASALADR